MKFKVNRDHFSTGLQQVMNVVGVRTTLPILSNVLIQAASDDRLRLTTNNLDAGTCCQVGAVIEQTGSITLPVRRLTSIIRSLPHLEVTLESLTNNQVKITSGGSSYKIMGLSPDDFPPLPSFSSQPAFALPQADLEQMLKSVAYAQSTDENRYILNGIYFALQAHKLTLVATDGRRLSLISQELSSTVPATDTQFIVPARTIVELMRLLGKGESVKVFVTPRQIAFEIGIDSASEGQQGLVESIHLVSKVVEGTYPNYTQVIPKETTHRIKLDRVLFQECLHRATLVTSDKHNSVSLKFRSNGLDLFAASTEYGESQESLAIAYEGPEIQLAFNPQFLLYPLKALTKDEVYFEFSNELSPGVIKTTDHFLSVIMPLRVQAKL